MTNRDAIVAFTADPDVSHTCWRVTRPLAALAKVGVPTQVVQLEGPSHDGWVYSPAYERVTFGPEVATLVLHRAIVPVQFRDSFSAWLAGVKASGVTIVYDTDDDVYSNAWPDHWLRMEFRVPLERADEIPEWTMMAQYRLDESQANRWILSQVDGITVSTAHLAEVIKRYTDKPVLVVPNAIDAEAFRAGLTSRANRPWPDHVSIGWCAGSRPAADFAPVGEAWQRIAERYPQVRFVMAGAPQDFRGIDPDRIRLVPYTDMAAYPWGMQVDIGCASAAPTEFNKSRSPIKAWEFALAGAAVVASETVYGKWRPVIAWANASQTADEWEMNIAHFIQYPDERHECAGSMRRVVDDEHALSSSLWRWQDAYRAIRTAAEPTWA